MAMNGGSFSSSSLCMMLLLLLLIWWRTRARGLTHQSRSLCAREDVCVCPLSRGREIEVIRTGGLSVALQQQQCLLLSSGRHHHHHHHHHHDPVRSILRCRCCWCWQWERRASRGRRALQILPLLLLLLLLRRAPKPVQRCCWFLPLLSFTVFFFSTVIFSSKFYDRERERERRKAAAVEVALTGSTNRRTHRTVVTDALCGKERREREGERKEERPSDHPNLTENISSR